MAAKKQQKRELTVLVRYTLKKDYPPKGLHAGDIVLYVENDRGVRYYTTLRRNKAHSCTCSGNSEYGRKCYHIKDLSQRENERYAARKAAKVAQREDKMPAQEVVQEPTNVVDISTRGNLNGAQSSAGFWESLPSRKSA
jgi:hypothetical protein